MEKETTSATVMPFYADERGYHEKDEGYDDDAVVVRAIGTCECSLSAEVGMNL
jgi:hypothetical protein